MSAPDALAARLREFGADFKLRQAPDLYELLSVDRA
jgi:hypothetical protein